ncbi:MAG: hypothetical protein DRJ03_31330 [Chloroflexi bacterium]|nr:MAG: hypothetical protein DRJ03_31330 [Chloroflexota bacterium]
MESPYKEIVEKDGKKFGLLILKKAKLSPYNLGSDLTEEERKEIVEALKESIDKQGLQQMMVATSKGEIFIGGSRLEALKELGIEEVWVEIRDGTPDQLILWSITENQFRKPSESRFLEEGKRFKEWLQLTGKSISELARQSGFSRQYVQDRIRMYEKLVEDLKGCRAAAGLTIEKAREIARTWTWTTEEEREKLLNNCIENNWDFKTLRRVIIKTREAKQILNTVEDEKIEKEVRELFEDLFFTPELDTEEMIYEIELRESGAPKTTRIEVPADKITEDEAINLANECHGAYVGKETKTYYILEANKTAFKRKKDKYGL